MSGLFSNVTKLGRIRIFGLRWKLNWIILKEQTARDDAMYMNIESDYIKLNT